MAKSEIKFKKVIVSAKRFSGNSLLGMIKLPTDIAETMGFSHLSSADSPIEIDAISAGKLNPEHFEIKEV